MRFKTLRMSLSKASPKLAHAIMFRCAMGKRCNLDHPRTFNEKISWLKFNEWPSMPLATSVADKFAVRSYVQECGYGHLLVDCLGRWSSVKELNFDTLPEKFVLKCNHGCGMNILCQNKNAFDVNNAKRKLSEWMSMDWGLMSAEPHYSSIKRQIICEQLVDGPLVDYKFLCFNGKPQFFFIAEGFEKSKTGRHISIYNLDGTLAPFTRTDHLPLEREVSTSPFINEMMSAAEELSKPFKFARIDFIVNAQHYYFSEVTLTPCAGMMPLKPKEWDLKLGDMLEI